MKCLLGKEEKVYIIDLGGNYSLIRKNFPFNYMKKCYFDNSLIVPVASSKIDVFIDTIPFRIKILLISDNQLSKVIIGWNVLHKIGV